MHVGGGQDITTRGLKEFFIYFMALRAQGTANYVLAHKSV